MLCSLFKALCLWEITSGLFVNGTILFSMKRSISSSRCMGRSSKLRDFDFLSFSRGVAPIKPNHPNYRPSFLNCLGDSIFKPLCGAFSL